VKYILLTLIFCFSQHVSATELTVSDKCLLHSSQLELHSNIGDYHSVWFKEEFWETLDSLETYNCSSYSKGLNLAGFLYYSNNNIVKAKESLFKAAELIGNQEESHELAQNQLFLGLVYVLEKENDHALTYFMRSLEISRILQDETLIADGHLNIGLAQIENGEFEKARPNLVKASEYFASQEGYLVPLGYVYLNLARIENANQNDKETIKLLEKAESIWEKQKHYKGIFFANQFKHNIAHEAGDHEKGIEYLLQAIDASKQSELEIKLSEVYVELAEDYEAIGDKKSYLENLEKALLFGKDLPTDELTDIVNKLGNHYFNSGDKQEFILFLKNIVNVLNVNSESNRIKSSKLYDSESLIDTLSSRTATLEDIKQENEKQIKNQFKTMGLILLGSLLIMWLIYQVSEERKKLNDKISDQNRSLINANERLQRSTNRIKEQNELYEAKNKELKNFAYVASHDLKSPLRTIISFTGLLKMKNKDKLDKKQLEYYDIIESSGKTLTTLIDDLLDHADLQSNNLKLASVNSQKIVKQAIVNLSDDINKYDASVLIDSGLPETIVADEIKIMQVFQNLISNSLKYSHPERKPEILILGATEDNENIFRIKDNGIGIKEEDQQRIFTMFEKLNSSKEKESTGIGLATCRKILKLHKGKIWADSNTPHGTTLSFSIPS